MSELLALACFLGVTFILGTWWGLWLAFTRQARMERFAESCHRAQLRLNEAHFRSEDLRHG